jgi:hypothetical protein
MIKQTITDKFRKFKKKGKLYNEMTIEQKNKDSREKL